MTISFALNFYPAVIPTMTYKTSLLFLSHTSFLAHFHNPCHSFHFFLIFTTIIVILSYHFLMSNQLLSLTNPKMKGLTSIWDDDHVIKYKTCWKCLWCGETKKGVSANRALSHVSKERLYGISGISFCTAEIPPDRLERYKNLASMKNNRRNSCASNKAHHANLIHNRQQATVTKMMKKQKLYNCEIVSNNTSLSSNSDQLLRLNALSMKDKKALFPRYLLNTCPVIRQTN